MRFSPAVRLLRLQACPDLTGNGMRITAVRLLLAAVQPACCSQSTLNDEGYNTQGTWKNMLQPHMLSVQGSLTEREWLFLVVAPRLVFLSVFRREYARQQLVVSQQQAFQPPPLAVKPTRMAVSRSARHWWFFFLFFNSAFLFSLSRIILAGFLPFRL